MERERERERKGERERDRDRGKQERGVERMWLEREGREGN